MLQVKHAYIRTMVQFRVLVIISHSSHEVTFNLIPNCKESCYGQISIETATYSLHVIYINSHTRLAMVTRFHSPIKHLAMPHIAYYYINSICPCSPIWRLTEDCKTT